jgi:hypothetical protein
VSRRSYTPAGTRICSRFLYENGVAVGIESALVSIDVDLDDLGRFLGRRAMGNKSGTAILGGGAVRVRVTKRVAKREGV